MYCDKPLGEFEIDGWVLEHIRPKFHGGGNTADNVGPACNSCGARKHIKTMDEFVGCERAQTIRARHPFLGKSPLYVETIVAGWPTDPPLFRVVFLEG
jgi:hypothetical protein